MPTKLNDIKKPRDKYADIITNEIRKIKSGYGITLDEMAEKCGLSDSQFRGYKFAKQFESHIKVINKTKYFVK